MFSFSLYVGIMTSFFIREIIGKDNLLIANIFLANYKLTFFNPSYFYEVNLSLAVCNSYFCKNFEHLIRITENNDWVIYCILGSIFFYVILLSAFQRDSNVKDFLTQKAEDTSNILLSWLIISVVRILMISVLLSQFVPIVPKLLLNIQVFDYQINKFGFTFISLILFDVVRNILTFLFYSSVGSVKNLKNLSLIASKYFFIESIVFIIGSFALFYYPIDLVQYFYTIIAVFIGSFILKNLIYFFNQQNVLPEKWYYKFLYICTLQIIPVLVLWKFLFY